MYETIVSFLGGVVTTLLLVYKWFAGRISPEEAKRIYDKAKETIKTYKKAKEDGKLTVDEKLKIADDAIATLEEIIKALER